MNIVEKLCKHGFDHNKLGVPCTECRMDMYNKGENIFNEIEKIQLEKS